MPGASGSAPTTFALLRESIHRYPAVKFAFWVAAALAVVALVYSLGEGMRVAMIVFGVIVALFAIMLVFAKISLHAPSDFEIPANVLVQIALGLFTVASVALFCALFFGIPFTIQQIRSATDFAFPHSDIEEAVLIPDTDSGWAPDHYDAGKLCAKQQSAYAQRYPSYNVDVASATEKVSTGTPPLYSYHCSFKATPH